MVTGATGLVGSSVAKKLLEDSELEVLQPDSSELNLLNDVEVSSFLRSKRPDAVVAAAAKVGGIMSNKEHSYTLLIQNLQMQNNLFHAAVQNEVQKCIFISSSCIYAKSDRAIAETDYFKSAPDENTRAYAIAKITGMETLMTIRSTFGLDYLSLIPSNLYGKNDNFHPRYSHVIPSLLYKFHSAKIEGKEVVEVWGKSDSAREFLHVDDLARGVELSLRHSPSDPFYNVGSGVVTTMSELVNLIRLVTSFEGKVKFNINYPSGISSKLLDSSKFRSLGWTNLESLHEGLADTYSWMVENFDQLRRNGVIVE